MNVIMLSVFMLNVIMLIVVKLLKRSEHKSCLGRVFNFKLAPLALWQNFCTVCIQPLL